MADGPPSRRRRRTNGTETTEDAIARYRATGDRAVRGRVVEEHWWLAVAVARQLKRSGEEFDDLAQVAMIGILKAIERFDPQFGVTFRTYASATARGEVRRHYRDAGWSVSVPRRLKDLRYDVAAATEVLRERLRRAPTSGEIAGYLRIPRDEVDQCLAAGDNFRALPIELPSGDERPAAALREDHWEERLVGALDASSELIELFDELPSRLRRVMVLRFVEERKQVEIAAEIGVSQVHVSRLIKQAVLKLRDVADRRRRLSTKSDVADRGRVDADADADADAVMIVEDAVEAPRNVASVESSLSTAFAAAPLSIDVASVLEHEGRVDVRPERIGWRP